MALQKKIVHCSVKLTIVGMVLRFVAAPASLAVGSLSVGLRGDVLRVVVIQVSIQVLYSNNKYNVPVKKEKNIVVLVI